MRLPPNFLFLSVFLALAMTLQVPCLAQSCLSQLDECERMFFGKTCPNLPATVRAEALERGLFGSSRTGSMAERLRAIQVTLGVSASPTVKPQANGTVLSQPAAPKSQKQSTAVSGHANYDTKELLKRAVMAHSSGNLSEASRLFEQVLAIDPKNTDANYNLGSMAEDRGDLDNALNYYRSAAASSPDDNDIKHAVASVERKVAKRQTSAQNAELKELAKQAGTAFKQGDYDGAISKLDALAQKEPSDASVQFGLSRVWYKKGDLDRSRQYLQGAIALAPEQQVYKNALQVLDKEIQTRQYGANGTAHSDASALTPLNTAAASGGVPERVTANGGGIVPFTDQGAPQPLPGSLAMVGSGTSVLPVGATLPPQLAASANPFDQAILSAMTGMSALSNTARAYSGSTVYPAYPASTVYPAYSASPYARPRMRLGRAGSLAGGLLGLLGVGY